MITQNNDDVDSPSLERFSQEVQLGVQGLHHFFNFTHQRLSLTILGYCSSLALVSTDIHVELCDLVSILAGCWNFDRSRPIEVKVAESVRQMLQLNSGERRRVLRHVEMCRQDTALVGSGRGQEEVKVIIGVTLDEALINYAA